MSLFTSFNAGVSGLRTAQSGMTTTAHNLSNTDTEGYTRQQNITSDMYYNTLSVTPNGINQIGYGTTVAKIRQIRDRFLDQEYRVEAGRQSFYEALSMTEKEVEDVFGEMEGVEFQNSLNEFWDSFQTLSTDPQSITNRQLFISKADKFIQNAQNVYNELGTYQQSMNEQIQDKVDQINKIGEQIADYNKTIVKVEAGGVESANDLRDARNLLLDQLAEITPYTYDEANNGCVQIYIDSVPFVIDGHSAHMECQKIKEQTYNPDTDEMETTKVSEMYDVFWKDNGFGQVYHTDEAFSTEKMTDLGALPGLLNARGRVVANYSDIPVYPKESDYYNEDGVLDDVGNEQFKTAMKAYEEDVKTYNNTIGNSIINTAQAQFDQLIHGMVTMVNDILCPNISTGDGLTGFSGTTADGEEITLDENSQVLDVMNCAVGTDDSQTVGTELFTRSTGERYKEVILDSQVYKNETDADGNLVSVPLAKENADGTFSLYVYQPEDTKDVSTMYTLQNLKINGKMVDDYSLLPLKANPSQGNTGAYDMSICEKMINGWNQDFASLDPNTLSTYSIKDYYNAMIGELGNKGQTWDTMVDTQTTLTEQIENKRQQQSGVSSDEEMVNLLTYQHAYNAASRYITVIDEMLKYLIENLN